MNFIGDVLLQSLPNDAHIARAVADAFGVRRVTVWPRSGVENVDTDFFVERETFPGEFPFALSLTATASSGLLVLSEDQIVDRMRVLAQRLEQSFLTDAAGFNPVFSDDYLLVTPNGDTAVVQVTFDGLRRGEIELTPESRTLLAELTAKTPTAAR
ncbi:MAG TPA: hypothetical protein VD767_08135 [Thermomicrobiales bacterium]|nr:hypothetical protein [Thermomicrobiales bacterium]